jgi:hypothetical protein
MLETLEVAQPSSLSTTIRILFVYVLRQTVARVSPPAEINRITNTHPYYIYKRERERERVTSVHQNETGSPPELACLKEYNLVIECTVID